ncbi:MAG: hypothetical protein LLF89_03035 [Spirochaetaceae bacterium]|nr:hypothetical protein [Spirochaetaceae bacterium]
MQENLETRIDDAVRHLDEKQFALVLARAAEIEARDREPAIQQGYSLVEAEAIAHEVGISAESFRKAVAELETKPGRRGWKRLLIGELRPQSRICIENTPDSEQLEEILDFLGRKSGLHGSGTVRRGKLLWSSDAFEVQRTGQVVDITVIPSSEGTEISAIYELRNRAGGIFGGLCGGIGIGGGIGLGFGVGMGVLNSPLFTALFSIGGFLATYLLARGIFAHISRRSQAEADKMTSLIADFIGSASEN